MRVKYIGEKDTLAFDREKAYEVMSIERDWYRIMTELGEDYLFPPEQFEVVEEDGSSGALEKMKGAHVRYVSGKRERAFVYGKAYEVLGVERGFYRIMTELGREYLCAPGLFEIVEE